MGFEEMSDHNMVQRVLTDDVLVIETGKTLDNNNAHEMVDLISNAQTRGFVYIMLDMADLEFLSSAGVGSVLGTVETSRESGGDIILYNVHETILHVLKVLDLDDYLTIRTGESEARSVCGLEQV